MARGYTTRKLEVYVIQGHLGDAALDYSSFFSALAESPATTRVSQLPERVLALPVIRVSGGRVSFVAYEGQRGQNPIIFDPAKARERIEQLARGEFVATKTHGSISLTSREAIIEFNQRGAKASDIALAFEAFAGALEGYEGVSIDFTPIADEEFAQAIDRFERISLARIRLVRPNIDWTDHYDRLSELAGESDGRTVEVEVTARRLDSLSRGGGIIRLIKSAVQERASSIKSAIVTGTREGEEASTSVSLNRYVAHQRVNVRIDENGHVDDADVERKIKAYLDARDETQSGGDNN